MKKIISCVMALTAAVLCFISCKYSSDSREDNTVYSDPITSSFKTSSFATSLTEAYCDLSWAVAEGTSSDTVCIFRGGEKIAEVKGKTTWRDTGVTPGTEYNYLFKNKDGKQVGALRTTIPLYVRYKLSYGGGTTSLRKSVNWDLEAGTASSVYLYVNGVYQNGFAAKTSDGASFAMQEAETYVCVLKDSKGHDISNEVTVKAIGSMQNPESSTAYVSGSIYSSVKLHLSAPNAESFVIIWENTETSGSAVSSIINSLTRKYNTADAGSTELELDVSGKNMASSTYLHFVIYPVDCDGIKYNASHIWFYGAGKATLSSK